MVLKWRYFAFVVFIWAGLVQADTIMVGPGGPGGGYDHATIQAGIDAANTGETVCVAPGRYYENINFNGKRITVSGTDPDDSIIVEGTIIDANGLGSVVTFANGEGRDSVLQGFTITGGIGMEWSTNNYAGGGIYCSMEVAPSILQNIIIGNIVSGYGGGLFCDVWSHVLLYKNTIMGNSAKYGGAICTLAAQIEARNNVICHNTARHRGGGLHLYGKAVLANNMVYGNETTYFEGGGIYLRSADYSTITGNTIAANNNKLYGASLHIELSENVTVTNNIIVNALRGPGIYLSDSSLVFKYNNVWNNAGGNYNGMSDPTGIDGNISDDPLFDPNSNDYHLHVTSPCINAGDPAFIAELGETDIDGEPRVRGGRIDIGADEFVVNLEPVADAGLDQTYSSIPSQVALDGSGSYDPGGDTISYHWTQIEGPAVALSDEHTVSPTFEPLEFGIYIFELVVNDGLVDSSPDTVGIVVGDNHAPVADAGSSRYAGSDPVQLDGTGSYDPDGYGELTYQWQQISGPAAVITDSNTAMPTISGFAQTSSIQKCEFGLVVNDGDLTSQGDVVKVIIVPSFGIYDLKHSNPYFDPDKPTIVAFDGGYDCSHGAEWMFYDFPPSSIWLEKANFVTTSGDWYLNRYENYGDLLIVYLSKVAPNYHQPIQTMGFSAGNGPAIDVANYINLTYADPRYAVNRVTLLDAACGDYPTRVRTFLASSVDGEQCWIDNYIATYSKHYSGTLNITFPGGDHGTPARWYFWSADPSSWPDGDMYANGVTAGFYYSVVGPGKNLQLAANTSKYRFKWIDSNPDYLVPYNSSYPGRLPEPVTLLGPNDGAVVDANGAVFSCEVSENSIGYQLLMGSDPYHTFLLFSDTTDPPTEVISEFPFEQTWWTVRAYDQYGSRIHADPICINAEKVVPTPIVQNLTTGKGYGHIQIAIDDASEGDEIVVSSGNWQYLENLNPEGKDLKVRSINPMDPSVVAATVINGGHRGPAVTFESGEGSSCMLRGFTIKGGAASKGNADGDTPLPGDMGTGGGAIACFYLWRTGPVISECVIAGNNCPGLYCYKSSPTIINCTFAGNDSNGVELQGRSLAKFTNCTIVGNGAYGIFGGYPTVSNCSIVGNVLSAIASYMPKVSNCILWGNAAGDELGQQIIDFDGRGPVTYSNVQGGWPGEGNIDADPCFVSWGYWDANEVWTEGDYHLQSLSPCIDAGDNNSLPPDTADLDGDGNTTELIPFDLDGNSRIADGNNDRPKVVDMGAYEFFVPPIECQMVFTPHALNYKSKGRWVKAHIVLPQGYDVNEVDTESPPRIVEPFELACESMSVFVNGDGLVEVEAAFSRSDFCASGPIDANVVVQGTLTTGRSFRGQDRIKIVNNKLEYLANLASYWLAPDCGKPDHCAGLDLNQDGAVNFADFAMFDGCCIEVVEQ